jgi:hypothetical protein
MNSDCGGGRMLIGSVRNVPLGGPNGQSVFISIDEITPAPELPTTKPDITGLFVERKDNTLVVQAVSFITVWGRRSGDRIIAEVLFYSNPQSVKKPGSQ